MNPLFFDALNLQVLLTNESSFCNVEPIWFYGLVDFNESFFDAKIIFRDKIAVFWYDLFDFFKFCFVNKT